MSDLTLIGEIKQRLQKPGHLVKFKHTNKYKQEVIFYRKTGEPALKTFERLIAKNICPEIEWKE